MTADESSEIIRRLEKIELALSDLSKRTGNLEQLIGTGPYNIRRSGAPPPMTPVSAVQEVPEPKLQEIPEPISSEPIQRQSLPPQVTAPTHSAASTPASKEVSPNSTKSDGSSVDEAEYKFGMNVLLKGGAIIVILGLLYLVALGITNGWITLKTQFAGEIALCLGFIGIGFWKRSEKEEFGQILMGIGSCGLYFSVAGGHIYKNLYEGELVVFLFLVLSLANLAYSYFISSRSFLLIGIVGGLIGSVLPMKEDRALLTTILHFLVVIPSAAIIIRNRWNGLAVVLSLVSSAALIPVFLSQEPWLIRITVMYGAAGIACFAYAKTFEKSNWDPEAAFIPFSAASAAIGGLLLDNVLIRNVSGNTNPAHGSYQVLFLAALMGVLGIYFKKQVQLRNVFWFTGVAIAAVLAPIGLERTPEAFTSLVISILISSMNLRLKSTPVSVLAWGIFGLSLAAYVSWWSSDVFIKSAELPYLILAMAVTVFHSWANHRSSQKLDTVGLLASLLCLPLLLRISEITIAPIWGGTERALLFGFAVFSSAMIAISYRQKWASLAVIGGAGTAWVFVSTFSGPPFGRIEELIVLTYLAALGLAFSATTKALENKSLPFQVFAPSMLVTILMARAAVLIFQGCAFPPQAAASIGLIFATLNLAYLSHRFRWTGTLAAGWCAACSGAFAAVMTPEVFNFFEGDTLNIRASSHLSADIAFSLLSHVGIVAMAVVSKGFQVKTKFVEPLAAILLFPLWVRFCTLVLGQAMGMSFSASVSSAWILFATISLVVGFWKKNQMLRYLSFVIFGLTITKVMLVDLASLAAGIRVVILLGLGITMLVGGYLYILSSKKSDSASEKIQ